MKHDTLFWSTNIPLLFLLLSTHFILLLLTFNLQHTTSGFELLRHDELIICNNVNVIEMCRLSARKKCTVTAEFFIHSVLEQVLIYSPAIERSFMPHITGHRKHHRARSRTYNFTRTSQLQTCIRRIWNSANKRRLQKCATGRAMAVSNTVFSAL
jgi:hypothetical protein